MDDLIARCRAAGAREAFAEAVACYRAGAFRAAIIATWSAVVFDYLSKLRELELVGNREAKNILGSFERAREQSDTLLSQQLERDILKDAQEKFELLSPLEREDLDRLRVDRHRSAHPSLITIEDPYAPPAELARCHLRNAAVHILSRPPLQGREAWARVWADVTSEYFPDDVPAATRVLQARLSRARDTLVRKVLAETVKKLLGPKDPLANQRFLAAAKSIVALFHPVAAKLLSEKLPSLVDAVGDDGLPRILRLCAEVPLCWESLPQATRDKVTTLCRRGDDVTALTDAMTISELRDVVRTRDLSVSTLSGVARNSRDRVLMEKVVAIFEKSNSFSEFRDAREVLRDESSVAALSSDHLGRLVRTLKTNATLRNYAGYSGVVAELLAATRGRPADLKDVWIEVFPAVPEFNQKFVADVYPDLVVVTVPTPPT